MKQTIKKYLEGNASEVEQRNLLDWMKVERNRRLYCLIKEEWRRGRTKSIVGVETEKGLLHMQSHILKEEYANQNRLRHIQKIYRYAIILLVLMLVGGVGGIIMRDVNMIPQTTVVIAEHGQISKVVLPDSTTVWLNSGSTLSYKNTYAFNNRELNLSGQAYLDVRKDEELPLIVSCEDLKVKVLGTKFDVKGYPEDENVKVKLDEGSVEVLHKELKNFKHRLEPGQVGLYNRHDGEIAIQSVVNNGKCSWKEGIMVFRNESMDEVIKSLERKFGISVMVMDSTIYKSRLNASFKNNSIEQIAEFIEFACKIDVQIVKEKETITSLILKNR